jgi:membrane protein YqaA with SNARE-associated domain
MSARRRQANPTACRAFGRESEAGAHSFHLPRSYSGCVSTRPQELTPGQYFGEVSPGGLAENVVSLRPAPVRLLETLTDFAQAAARRPRGISAFVRHFGAFGLLLLAVVDSTPIPTFAGPDILTAILAARQREPWYYYAAATTAGSVIGAYLTFRMARKAGSDYLSRKFGQRRVATLMNYFNRWGTGALVVSTVVPLPFPTSAFFAAAGALDYPLRTFIVVVALARAGRYGAIAAVAFHYRRRFVRGLRHLVHHPGWLVAIAAAAVFMVTVTILLRKRLESSRPLVNTRET